MSQNLPMQNCRNTLLIAQPWCLFEDRGSWVPANSRGPPYPARVNRQVMHGQIGTHAVDRLFCGGHPLLHTQRCNLRL